MSANAYDQAEAAHAILLDWDGCVVEGGRLKPGATAFLCAFARKISILSNNSTHAPGQLAAILARAGAPVSPARIHLAGQIALEEAARRCGGRPAFLLASAAMTRAAANLGLNLAKAQNPAAVVLLRDTGFSYRKLEAAVAHLRGGAAFIVSNPDLTHPKPAGVAPETGALMAAIGACVDLATVDVTMVGKPSAMLFERALSAAGVAPAQALMIGDNPATDVAGAERVGVASLLLGAAAGATLESIMRCARAGRIAA